MRCLTLADALKERGSQVRFLCRHLQEHLRQLLDSKEHAFISVDAEPVGEIGDLAHSEWLGTSQRADAKGCIDALRDQPCDWLVVDHYALDERWETPLRQCTGKIFAIDDIADRTHDCDLLLDQNFYGDMHDRYTGKVPHNCILLLGPKFALLREEFRQLHAIARPRMGPVKRMFVFFGGTDSGNFTGVAIDALENIPRQDLHVDFVIGAQHSRREQIKNACERNHFDCHIQTNRMGELMAAADLAIGAGGATTWERCALGLPSVVVAIAANQVPTAVATSRVGATKFLGSASEISATRLAREVCASFDSTWINRTSRFCLEMVDAQGVPRIIEQMSDHVSRSHT